MKSVCSIYCFGVSHRRC